MLLKQTIRRGPSLILISSIVYQLPLWASILCLDMTNTVDPWITWVRGIDLLHNHKSEYNFLLPQNLTSVVPCICGGLVPGLVQIPKSEDSQVPYIKCRRTVYTVCPPLPLIPSFQSKILFSIKVVWMHRCEILGYKGPTAYLMGGKKIHL